MPNGQTNNDKFYRELLDISLGKVSESPQNEDDTLSSFVRPGGD